MRMGRVAGGGPEGPGQCSETESGNLRSTYCVRRNIKVSGPDTLSSPRLYWTLQRYISLKLSHRIIYACLTLFDPLSNSNVEWSHINDYNINLVQPMIGKAHYYGESQKLPSTLYHRQQAWFYFVQKA